jgi:uridine kinase
MSIKKSDTYIIGISGGSGSGKTSFIRDLKSHFSDDEICFLSQDEYYKPREYQVTDENGVSNFDLPDSIDQDEFYFDLVKLMSGLAVEKQEYTFNNSTKNPEVLIFKPAPIIIVEGLFVFQNPKVFDILDLKVLLHASDTQKIIRRIKRDRVERNYPLEDVLYRYEHHVLPSFESYIQPFFNKVDIIINNNKTYLSGKDMLVSFLQTKLHHPAKVEVTER